MSVDRLLGDLREEGRVRFHGIIAGQAIEFQIIKAKDPNHPETSHYLVDTNLPSTNRDEVMFMLISKLYDYLSPGIKHDLEDESEERFENIL